jgi:hypothetical protein
LAQLALELVDADPEKAHKLGLLSLSGNGIPETFGRLLFALSNYDQSLSNSLCREAIANMRRNNYIYSPMLFSLSNYAFDQQGKPLPDGQAIEAQLLVQYLVDATIAHAAMSRESRQSGAQATSDASARLYNFLIARGTSIIDLNAPDKQALLRTLLSDLREGLNQQQIQQTEKLLSEQGREVSVLNGENSSIENQIRNAEKEKDPEMRNLLLRQAALALMRGDSERAFSTAAKISDAALRAQTEDDINITSLSAKLRGLDYDEARQAALKLNDLSLRAKMLAELANTALSKTKELSRASELLDEAYSITTKSENTLNKLEAFLIIADGFAKFDSNRGFEVLSAAVKTINQLDTQNSSFQSKSAP